MQKHRTYDLARDMSNEYKACDVCGRKRMELTKCEVCGAMACHRCIGIDISGSNSLVDICVDCLTHVVL